MGYFYLFMTSGLKVESINRPMFVPRLPDTRGGFLLKPLVETQCQQVDHFNERNMFFPNDKLWTSPGIKYQNNTWPIPRESWSLFSDDRSDALYIRLKWVDMQSYFDHPSIGAVISTPTAIRNESGWFQGTNVFACSINAWWIPTDLSYDPSAAAVSNAALLVLELIKATAVM